MQLSEKDVHGAQALPEPHGDPKADALVRASSGPQTAAAASVANRDGPDPEKDTVPYSLYRSLRLDSIRTALGLGVPLKLLNSCMLEAFVCLLVYVQEDRFCLACSVSCTHVKVLPGEQSSICLQHSSP